MAVHAAWPPLACLAMFVMVVAFLIIKYGDRLCSARSVPIPRSPYDYDDDDNASSVNTVSCLYEEKGSIREMVEIVEMPDLETEMQHTRLEKYEYAV
ncbi:hypothetical protein Pcinc_043737 [Petrolisthes cinctipes]|uniref:Uncharacterized protein n=1 Tax=Petrolisthes cinctipes TaxID=88211 RepID=A0AAE1BG61_PETCI|nr:hypothetical protein Pcinc_043737 [Petrolisthes cinctipes]